VQKLPATRPAAHSTFALPQLDIPLPLEAAIGLLLIGGVASGLLRRRVQSPA
jgi:hypothetical protein